MNTPRLPDSAGGKSFAAWLLVVLLQVGGTGFYAVNCENRGKGHCEVAWALFLGALGMGGQTIGAAISKSPLNDPGPPASAPPAGDVIPIGRPRRPPDDEPPAA